MAEPAVDVSISCRNLCELPARFDLGERFVVAWHSPYVLRVEALAETMNPNVVFRDQGRFVGKFLQWAWPIVDGFNNAGFPDKQIVEEPVHRAVPRDVKRKRNCENTGDPKKRSQTVRGV